MEIIHADQRHVGLIAPLFDAYRQFYRAQPDPAGAQAFIAARLAGGESVIFLAQAVRLPANSQSASEDSGRGPDAEGPRALGFVQLYPTFASVAMQSLWLLNDLYVAPQARRQGVGEALMRRAEEFARETGSRGLFLRTAADNIPAQRLYERCGWVRDTQFFRYDKVLG